jgi:hypothetical protein
MNAALALEPATRGRVPWKRRAVLLGAAVLLAAAVCLQLVDHPGESPRSAPRVLLGDQLPRVRAGWVVTDEPLGATEAVRSTTVRTLRFDDYVYRRYQSGSRAFTIYAAYWAPGRMPTRLVASHTPDRCWTEAGMQCVDMRFREQLPLDGWSLLPAEYRVFTGPAGAERVHVVYWHLVDGEAYDYGARFNRVPHAWLWWKDVVAQATRGAREQMFVRIASATPLDQLLRDVDFQAVLSSVAQMGIGVPQRAVNSGGPAK